MDFSCHVKQLTDTAWHQAEISCSLRQEHSTQFYKNNCIQKRRIHRCEDMLASLDVTASKVPSLQRWPSHRRSLDVSLARGWRSQNLVARDFVKVRYLQRKATNTPHKSSTKFKDALVKCYTSYWRFSKLDLLYLQKRCKSRQRFSVIWGVWSHSQEELSNCLQKLWLRRTCAFHFHTQGLVSGERGWERERREKQLQTEQIPKRIP